MRREADVSLLCCPVTVRERLLCDELRAACGITSDANLVRMALYHWARFQKPGQVDTRMFARRDRDRPMPPISEQHRQRISAGVKLANQRKREGAA